MRVLYIMAIPLAVVIIGLFLVIGELSRAVQRNTARLEAFYHIRLDDNSSNAIAVLNQELVKNKSFFNFNLSSADVDDKLCGNIIALMIVKAKNNRQEEFLMETKYYEEAHCAN